MADDKPDVAGQSRCTGLNRALILLSRADQEAHRHLPLLSGDFDFPFLFLLLLLFPLSWTISRR